MLFDQADLRKERKGPSAYFVEHCLALLDSKIFNHDLNGFNMASKRGNTDARDGVQKRQMIWKVINHNSGLGQITYSCPEKISTMTPDAE